MDELKDTNELNEEEIENVTGGAFRYTLLKKRPLKKGSPDKQENQKPDEGEATGSW